MRCVLGIDSGGSKCHAMLVREDGELLGWARTEPGSAAQANAVPPVFGGWGRSEQVVRDAITLALANHKPEELHLCVVGPFLEKFCRQAGVAYKRIHVIDEPTAAFTLSGVDAGVCVLSGTGSFVHGRTRDGRARHLDGLGPLLGDRGSGYDIGLRTLQAAARSGWHERHRTALAATVREVCGGRVDDAEGVSLIAYTTIARDRSEIAHLSRFALAAAEAGDAVALRIVEDAAGALAESVYDVVDQLEMRDQEYPLIGTGGVVANSDLYWQHLCRKALAFAPRLQPLRPEFPPVVGVALAGLAGLPGANLPAARERLLSGCRRMLTMERGAASPPVIPIGGADKAAPSRRDNASTSQILPK